jgi:hypothetical protein
MNNAILTCQNEQRRNAVRANDRLNGLDYLEVDQQNGQYFLCVHFLGPVPSADQIRLEHIRIEGGQRIRDVRAIALTTHTPEDRSVDGCLRINVDKLGDFSAYTLRIVNLPIEGSLHLDPRYDQLEFFFRTGCPSDLDCKTQPVCPPEPLDEPEINYLAKDYASFRQLILDRLALIMPDWQERHVPDLGITLVEILAYVGDYLSYYQDAVATEAYLDTARQRISVRRHVRLVDYPMHEGCNARTWLWLETSSDQLISLKEAFFITSYPNPPTKGTVLKAADLIRTIPANQYEVFEPLVASTQSEMQLYQAHNKICFYTWGDRQCCIPKGATTATLRDDWELPPVSDTPVQSYAEQKSKDDGCDEPGPTSAPKSDRRLRLKAGDILIFEEVKGAKTGIPGDADFTHRHAVRLTKVTLREDTVYPYEAGKCDDNIEPGEPNPQLSVPIVEIEWATADALPFSLCISAIGPAPNCTLIDNISVARGNVLLVDHGRTIQHEDLGKVLEKETIIQCVAENQPTETIVRPERFQPHLQYAPLTFQQPLSDQDLQKAPATGLLTQSANRSLPHISLTATLEASEGDRWIPQPNLLGSQSQSPHFVVEADDEGVAHLRFGDGEFGQLPAANTQFAATYRIGNGTTGNLGAETLAYLVLPELPSGIHPITPHNPFPAQGGTPPEPIADVKLFAPHAFRQELQRAITTQDYAAIVMRDFGATVQRAAARLRWTGSWYEVQVVIDPIGTEVADPTLLQAITTHLARYRRMGHDVVVQAAIYVALDIAMLVCVQPGYQKGQVKAALLEIFSDRRLPNGRWGFFHPDNLTFGTGIALSQLLAAAQAVPGVQSATITKLQRFAEAPNGEIDQGLLSLNSLEVARLDNDPNFPENGQFVLDMRGGR